MQVLERIGNFITGTYLDEEEVISATSKVVDGRTYYYYEINASYGKVGPHTLTAVTTKVGASMTSLTTLQQFGTSQHHAAMRYSGKVISGGSCVSPASSLGVTLPQLCPCFQAQLIAQNCRWHLLMAVKAVKQPDLPLGILTSVRVCFEYG